MTKKQYKTGESQRRAVKAYQERNKGRQKTFSVCLTSEQYEHDRATITAHGLTTSKFWRWAIEKLKAEPLPDVLNDE